MKNRQDSCFTALSIDYVQNSSKRRNVNVNFWKRQYIGFLICSDLWSVPRLTT